MKFRISLFIFLLIFFLLATKTAFADLLFPGQYFNPEYSQHVRNELFAIFGGFFILNLLINLIFTKSLLLIFHHGVSWKQFLGFIPLQTIIGFIIDAVFFKSITSQKTLSSIGVFPSLEKTGEYIRFLEKIGPHLSQGEVITFLLITIGIVTIAVGFCNFFLSLLILKLSVKKSFLFAFIFMILTSPAWTIILESPIYNLTEKVIGPRPPMILGD